VVEFFGEVTLGTRAILKFGLGGGLGNSSARAFQTREKAGAPGRGAFYVEFTRKQRQF
jgi:hypothetical protein